MTNTTRLDDQDLSSHQQQIRQRIEYLLPEIISRTLNSTGDPLAPLDDNPLTLFVDLMALLQAPSAAVLANLHDYFDVYSTPERLLSYLASWFDLQTLWIDSLSRYDPNHPPDFPAGSGRLRQLLASIRMLTQLRGTAPGLMQFLEIATGIRGFIIDEAVVDDNGFLIPFHIEVQIPVAAQPYRRLIERIVQTERPAHVTCQVSVQPPPSAGPALNEDVPA